MLTETHLSGQKHTTKTNARELKHSYRLVLRVYMDCFDIFKIIPCFLIVFSRFGDHCCGFAIESIAITRSVNPIQQDVFRLLDRDSRCKEATQRDCRIYNGMQYLKPRKCKCSCSSGSPTFGFHDGKWSCVNNSRVSQQSGCSFRFQGEATTSTSIKVLSEQSYHKIILPSINCWIEYSKSRFLRCNGKWIGLDTLINPPGPFSTLPFVETIAGTNMKIYTMKISKATLLSGRLISLHFSCQAPAKSSCILFKMAGTMKCPVSFATSTTTIKPTTTTTKTSTERKSTIKFISTVVLATQQQETPQGISPIIVGVVTALGIVCIIIVATVVTVILLKRKKSKRSSNRDDLNASRSSYMEPTPSQTPNQGLIYDYAIVESSRINPAWVTHRDPNTGYEIPKENGKKLYINIPKTTEPVYEVAQGLLGNGEGSTLRDSDEYVTLYNDDGSPGWQT